MLKKIRKFLLPSLLLAILAMTVSCHKDPVVFDGKLIVGKWVLYENGRTGTEFYRYDADSTGVTWDTSDDVQESEGQPFTWSFDENTSRLTVVHQMEMGGVIPKAYTMKALNDTAMEYEDNYSRTFVYHRVN